MRYFLMIALAFGLTFALSFFAVPIFAKKALLDWSKQCENCQLNIKHLSFALPASFTLREIELVQGDPKSTEVRVKIAKVEFSLSLAALFSKTVKLKQIKIFTPEVLVTEGDFDSPPHKKKTDSAWRFLVAKTTFEKGNFIYSRTRGIRSAVIQVHDINGTIGLFGNTEALHSQESEATLTAKLEKSGDFNLGIQAFLFEAPLRAKVKMEMKNLQLAELNPYFSVEDAIMLKGKLFSATATSDLKDQHISSTVLAKYDGLDISFARSNERSRLAAFFSNLIADMKMQESDLKKKRADQQRSAERVRQPRETLLQSLFRSWRDAAMKVAGS